MEKLYVPLILIMLTSTGCASLIVRDNDTAGETTGKVVARLLLAIATLGISERQIFDIERKENLEDSMNSWVGASSDDLVGEWGQPTSVNKLTNGGSVLTYNDGGARVFFHKQGAIVSVPITCQQDFSTDSSGRITSWRYQGHCY